MHEQKTAFVFVLKARPKVRVKEKGELAVVVISSAAPSLIIRLWTGIVGLMKTAAGMLGAETIGVLTIGIAARAQKQNMSGRTLKKACWAKNSFPADKRLESATCTGRCWY